MCTFVNARAHSHVPVALQVQSYKRRYDMDDMVIIILLTLLTF